MSRLMILGAGFPQAQLLQAAKRLGYETIICSIPGDYPAFSMADEISYTDISDPEAVLEAARALHIDGIATCCLDTGIQALGHTCDGLGLPGLSERSAICCADKWQMKNALMDAGVNTARCYKVTDRASLAEALTRLDLPVVLKAVDLQGSKGVYICRTEEAVYDSYEQARSLTRKDHCILEEFIEGNELGAQAFIYHGEILFVLPHGDITYMSKTNVPIGHYVPLDASQTVLDAAIEQSKKGILALGLDDCAVNIDLIEKDGKVYMIELTGRAGATCLPELVSIYYGVDYFEMIAAMAMGSDPRELFDAREGRSVANASRMLLSEKSGTVKHIEDAVVRDAQVYDLSLIVQEGDYIQRFTNAKDRLGQVIVYGETTEGCLQRIDEIVSQIKIEVE